eukprot:1154513-Pelagomonas_calceolata.AAC.5
MSAAGLVLAESFTDCQSVRVSGCRPTPCNPCNPRPGQQLEVAQRQRADICKNIKRGKAVKLRTILERLLGVTGTFYAKRVWQALDAFKDIPSFDAVQACIEVVSLCACWY